MEPTTQPDYTEQLDLIYFTLETMINRIEMILLLTLFLSSLYVYSLLRRNITK